MIRGKTGEDLQSSCAVSYIWDGETGDEPRDRDHIGVARLSKRDPHNYWDQGEESYEPHCDLIERYNCCCRKSSSRDRPPNYNFFCSRRLYVKQKLDRKETHYYRISICKTVSSDHEPHDRLRIHILWLSMHLRTKVLPNTRYEPHDLPHHYLKVIQLDNSYARWNIPMQVTTGSWKFKCVASAFALPIGRCGGVSADSRLVLATFVAGICIQYW